MPSVGERLCKCFRDSLVQSDKHCYEENCPGPGDATWATRVSQQALGWHEGAVPPAAELGCTFHLEPRESKETGTREALPGHVPSPSLSAYLLPVQQGQRGLCPLGGREAGLQSTAHLLHVRSSRECVGCCFAFPYKVILKVKGTVHGKSLAPLASNTRSSIHSCSRHTGPGMRTNRRTGRRGGPDLVPRACRGSRANAETGRRSELVLTWGQCCAHKMLGEMGYYVEARRTHTGHAGLGKPLG